jgi:two-component system cell cycle sensor histidine kinase/response regulator CckA
MRIFKNTSIRRKQMLVIMLTSSVALLLACAAFVAYDTVTFRGELSQRVTILADAVGNNCAAAIDFNDPKTAEETLAALHADDNIVSACVYSHDGQVFAVYHRDGASSFVPPPVQPAGQEFTRDELHLFRVIKQGGVMTGTIFVASDLKGLSSRLMNYVTIVGMVFLTSLLAALLLSSRLQRLVSNPILHLARVARTVAQDKNYSLRAAKQSDDEIGQLVDGFNEMLVQIQQRDAALQSARDELEVRVVERTTELAKTNKALQEENTERKRVEEALAVERNLLRAVIDLLPDCIYAKDTQHRFLLSNEACALLMGAAAPAELIGKTDADFYPSELEANFHADELAVLKGVPLINKEEPATRPDGTREFILTTKLPLKDGSGNIIGLVGCGRNITDYKRAEAALAAEQARFKFIFDSVPLGISLVMNKPDGKLTRLINDAHLRVCGLTREQADIRENFLRISHPDDRAHQAELSRQIVEGKINQFSMEKRYLRLDGSIVWVVFSYERRKYPDGSFEELSTVVDITALKKAQEEAAYERDLLRTLLDNSPDHIYFKDTQSRFIKASKAQVLQFGVKSPDEMVGKTDFDFFTEEHARPAFEDEQEIIRTGRPMIDKEEREVWRDGHVTWASSTKMPLRDGTGKIIGIMGISRDSTERRRAEESLRLLSSAVEQAKESIMIVETKPDEPWPNILFINPAFTQMTGYPAEEAIGKSPEILHGPGTDPTLSSRIGQDIEQSGAFAGEAIHYRKDGTKFYVELHIAPLRNADGKITHFVIIQHDITGRKRLEAHLFQSQKMETVGKLAGGIAHEFNSILTAIIGQSELLLGDLPAGSPLAKNATEISKAADRAAMLTRQLLAYGRKQFLRPEVLNLNQVITSMDGVLGHLMGGEMVDVNIIPTADLHLVKADTGQIEQVIMNLAMNARDAMLNGGKLTLETANVSFDRDSVGRYPELKPGGYVMLAITDTGRGMSEEVKARLFEPFFTTKDVGQGTGLGLSTCYGIIKQSGGHISVYSEPGRGTTFKIYLPQVEPQTKIPIERLNSPDLPRGTETILLVEDDPTLREMAATLLRRLGYTVLTAANGIEALNLKQERSTGHIDLLFTDVVMPHMSGKELSDRVRALYPHTRILFTSAYTENAIVHQGVLDKGVVLLQKPFTPSALALKVREALDAPGGPKPDAAQKTSGLTKISDEVKTPGN